MDKVVDPGEKTFKRVTNNHIYKEVMETKNHVIKIKEEIKFNRKWLYGLSTIVLAVIVWGLST